MTSCKGAFACLATLTIGLCGASVAQPQDGQPAYVRVVPAKPLPSMPMGAQSTVLYGNPSKPGLFAVLIKLPTQFKLPVHSHPDERVRTVISGTYYSAVGDKFEPAKLLAFPAGTFSHVPPKVWQFAETRDEEVVFQITGIGPTDINYLDPDSDPRKK